MLIRIERNAGHGAGKPLSKRIAESADSYAFLFYNTQTEYKTATTEESGRAENR